MADNEYSQFFNSQPESDGNEYAQFFGGKRDPIAQPEPKKTVGFGTKALNTAQEVGRALYDLPTNTLGYAANLAEGSRPLDETNWADKAALSASQRQQERMTAPDVNEPTLLGTRGDWRQTAASIPFSLGSMAGAVAGGAAGAFVPAPGASVVGGLAGAGLPAYRADSAMFVRQGLDKFAQDYQAKHGVMPSGDEMKAEQERLQPFAQQHGLAEAGPEAVGNVIGAKLLAPVMKATGGLGVLKKAGQAAVGIAGEELPTETATQIMQHNIEANSGVSGEAPRDLGSLSDWGTSLGEVAMSVLQQSLLMGGGAGAARMAYNKFANHNAPQAEPTQEQPEPMQGPVQPYEFMGQATPRGFKPRPLSNGPLGNAAAAGGITQDNPYPDATFNGFPIEPEAADIRNARTTQQSRSVEDILRSRNQRAIDEANQQAAQTDAGTQPGEIPGAGVAPILREPENLADELGQQFSGETPQNDAVQAAAENPSENKSQSNNFSDVSAKETAAAKSAEPLDFKPTHLLNNGGTPVIEGEDSFGKYWQAANGDSFDHNEPVTPIAEQSNALYPREDIAPNDTGETGADSGIRIVGERPADGATPGAGGLVGGGVVGNAGSVLPAAEVEGQDNSVNLGNGALDPILTTPKTKWVTDQLKEQQIKAKSPGFEAKREALRAQYDAELDKALAHAPFEAYAAHPANKGISPDILRQSHDALRQEYGVQNAQPGQPNANPARPEPVDRPVSGEGGDVKDFSKVNVTARDLMQMPLETKEDAENYVKAHKRYLDINGSGGTHQPRPASWKPPSVRNPETFDKLDKAWEVAGMNYWQMPYEEAKKLNRFRGLPKKKWIDERQKRGLSIDESTQTTPTPSKEPRVEGKQAKDEKAAEAAGEEASVIKQPSSTQAAEPKASSEKQAEQSIAGQINPRILARPVHDKYIAQSADTLSQISIKQSLGDPAKVLKNAEQKYRDNPTNENLGWLVAVYDKINGTKLRPFSTKKGSDAFIEKSGISGKHESFKTKSGKWEQIYKRETASEAAGGVLGAAANSLKRSGFEPYNTDSYESALAQNKSVIDGADYVNRSQIDQLSEAGIAYRKSEAKEKPPIVSNNAEELQKPAAPVTDNATQHETVTHGKPKKNVDSAKDSAKPDATKRNAISDHDDLLSVISKLGGISRAEAKAQGIDPKALNARGSGIKRVFTTAGKSYDEMSELLRGYHFDVPMANDLVDKVSRSINQGEKFYNPVGHERIMELKASERYNDEQAQVHAQLDDAIESGNLSVDDLQEALDNLDDLGIKESFTGQDAIKALNDYFGIDDEQATTPASVGKSDKEALQSQAGQQAESPQSELAALFASLGKTGFKKGALAKLEGHPQADIIKTVQEHWLDIVADKGYEEGQAPTENQVIKYSSGCKK